jgi:adenylate cyclase
MLTAHSLKYLPDSGSPTTEEVQSYLRQLLGREGFSASERNRRFLSYVVQETLEGRADRIKAYSIALAAFDRTGDFDPLTDPIVRIEAGRLRRSLEHYYLTAGQADRIRIDIPKGSYAATFSYQEEVAGALAPAPISSEASGTLPRYRSAVSYKLIRLAAVMVACGMIVGSLATYGITNRAHQAALGILANNQPSLVIVPFEDTGGDPSRAFVARGLTYDVGMALTQLGDVAVFGPGHVLDNSALRSERASDFTLMGSVQTDRHSMRVAVFLVDSRTRQFLQSWSYRKDLITNDIMSAQAEVAQQILASLRKKCAHDTVKRSTATVEGTFDCRPIAIAAN